MLTLDDARKVIAAAEKKAKEIEQPMNIAVADAGGNLVAHVRMDEAWMGSIDISIKKAFTSRAFDISTKDLAKFVPIRRPVLRDPCVQRRSRHDLRRRRAAQARGQGGGRHRREWWFGRAGSCCGRSGCRSFRLNSNEEQVMASNRGVAYVGPWKGRGSEHRLSEAGGALAADDAITA